MKDSIDFLDKIMSAAFSLRKIQQVILCQTGTACYNMRPQIHVLVIAPFGTGKSSISKTLFEKYPKEIYRVDDLSKASIYGSINKQSEYIPSSLIKCAGKLMIVDEWDNIRSETKSGLLSVLENQFLSKDLGFKVRIPFKFKNKFINYRIKDNHIEGNFIFACIAYAMKYPRITDFNGKTDYQKTYALLSRFSPIFIEPTVDFMTAMRQGEFELKINDHSFKVEKIIIEKNCYLDFSEKYNAYITKHKLIPEYNRDFGIINRVSSEIIRYGIHSFLSEQSIDFNKKEVEIKDVNYFTSNFDYIHALFNNIHNTTSHYDYSRYKSFREIILQEGDTLTNEQLRRRLGVSHNTILAMKEKYKSTELDSQDESSKKALFFVKKITSQKVFDADVLKLLENGKSTKEVSEQLNISRRHVFRVKAKVKEKESSLDELENEKN